MFGAFRCSVFFGALVMQTYCKIVFYFIGQFISSVLEYSKSQIPECFMTLLMIQKATSFRGFTTLNSINFRTINKNIKYTSVYCFNKENLCYQDDKQIIKTGRENTWHHLLEQLNFCLHYKHMKIQKCISKIQSYHLISQAEFVCVFHSTQLVNCGISCFSLWFFFLETNLLQSRYIF